VTDPTCAVVSLVDIALYCATSAAPPHSHHPTTLILQHQLSSFGPDGIRLCTPRAISRGHSLHVQIPTLSNRLASIVVNHQPDFKIYIVPSSPPTCAITITRFCHRSSSRLAGRLRIQKRYSAWSGGVENSGSECWQERKGEVRGIEKTYGRRGCYG
jgi:hypothetical protein